MIYSRFEKLLRNLTIFVRDEVDYVFLVNLLKIDIAHLILIKYIR